MGFASDAAVIARSLAEPEAFGEIFDRHAPTLLRFLVRRLGPDAADGLVGEVFRIAFERRKSYDGSTGLALPWLYGIASNLVLKHRRSEGRRLRANARLLAREVPARRDAVYGASDARLLFPRVIEAIEALPDAERDALFLYAWEDLSYEEVAAALAVPVGTIRSRLNRARTALRERAGASGKEQGRSRSRDPGRRRR